MQRLSPMALFYEAVYHPAAIVLATGMASAPHGPDDPPRIWPGIP